MAASRPAGPDVPWPSGANNKKHTGESDMGAKQSHGIGVGVFQAIADLYTGDPAVIAKRAEELGFDAYWLPELGVLVDAPEAEPKSEELGPRPKS